MTTHWKSIIKEAIYWVSLLLLCLTLLLVSQGRPLGSYFATSSCPQSPLLQDQASQIPPPSATPSLGLPFLLLPSTSFLYTSFITSSSSFHSACPNGNYLILFSLIFSEIDTTPDLLLISSFLTLSHSVSLNANLSILISVFSLGIFSFFLTAHFSVLNNNTIWLLFCRSALWVSVAFFGHTQTLIVLSILCVTASMHPLWHWSMFPST